MAHVKGILDFYLNFNEIAKFSSELDSQKKFSDFLYSQPSTNIDQILSSNPSLKKSFNEVIEFDRILYSFNDVDNYIIYFNKREELKLSIIWKSDQNLINVVEKIPKCLKKYFKYTFKKFHENSCNNNIAYFKSKFIMFNNHLITENTVLFYAFFKNSCTRDQSVDISNLNIQITYKLFDSAKIWNFILLIIGNILIYSFVPSVAFTTISTSILTFLCFLITDYIFNKKYKFSIDISSLTFNDDPKQITSMVESSEDDLRNIDLTQEDN